MAYLVFDRNANNARQVVGQTIPGYLKPIALRNDGQVVYGEARDRHAIRGPILANLQPYTRDTYRLRRKYCDSALGMLMIDNPRFTERALTAITNGIKDYVHTIPPETTWDRQNHQAVPNNQPRTQQTTWAAEVHIPQRTTRAGVVPAHNKAVAHQAGRYVANATSFGRLTATNAPPRGGVQPAVLIPGDSIANVARWLPVLAKGRDIPKMMYLYDVFFEMYVILEHRKGTGVAASPKDEATRLGWRQSWFDQAGPRGRVQMPNPPYSRMPGILPDPQNNAQHGLDALTRAGVAQTGLGNYSMLEGQRMNRHRGIDKFAINRNTLRPEYKADLDRFALNFSASASGTTSTLISSANSFASEIVMNMEMLKQYLMACVGYLVGGGMHTCHEVFYTASLKREKLYYKPGRYKSMLPQSFKTSMEYQRWRSEFWDVVENRELPLA